MSEVSGMCRHSHGRHGTAVHDWVIARLEEDKKAQRARVDHLEAVRPNVLTIYVCVAGCTGAHSR